MGGHLLFDLDDSLPPRHSNKAQGYGPQPKANEPSSQGRQYVILPLGKGRCEDLDLSTVETDALVEPADVLALGFGIREQDLGRTGLEDDVVPRRVWWARASRSPWSWRVCTKSVIVRLGLSARSSRARQIAARCAGVGVTPCRSSRASIHSWAQRRS